MKEIRDNFIVKDQNEDIVIGLSSDEINEKYIRGEIRIITEQARYPLDTISSMLASGKYNLNPEYQRRKRWSTVQQSKLIESFIINVPIPPIFLYEVEYAKYEVMDGLQRLTAIDNFYKGKFALEGLEEWQELNGKRYEELPSKVKEGIDRRYLSSIVLLNETAKDKLQAESLKKIVFGRLNSGGDKLTPQETRNALYGGKFNTCCIKLSQNEYFRKLWKFDIIQKNENGEINNEDELLKTDSYKKMVDVELVIRFFAYRHIDKMSTLGNQEILIDEYLKQANFFPDEVIDDLCALFEQCVKILYMVFGDKALLMPDGAQKKITPTKTIYDPIMQSISKFINREDLILSKKDELLDNKFKDKSALIIKGRHQDIDLFDGKYGGKKDVENRIIYFDNYFNSIINA
ncbi:MAG: hypothetical protein H6Q15_1948 [Bacteroidetes bacterium]|nr:hypothetical protein [Bacteroidota bacterium]